MTILNWVDSESQSVVEKELFTESFNKIHKVFYEMFC